MTDNPGMVESRDFIAADRLPVTGRRLILLRWWLLAGLTLAVLVARSLLEIALPLAPLAVVLLLLAGFNMLALRSLDNADFGVPELGGQLAVDLAGMGVLLYLSGGAANPLVSLLLLPVAVASLSLPGSWVAGIVGMAIGLYSFLMLYSLPLSITDSERATRLHLGGMWLTFVVSALLVAWFVTRMTASIRARDAQLAAAREDALRDAQVVALGQLAAGAAHELGTPLATMSVLGGELAQDPRLPADVCDDLKLLCRQIVICKDIVGGLTKRAGIERAGSARGVAADVWLEGVLGRWRTLWPQASCIFDMTRDNGAPPLVAADAALEQAVVNLLNNAARVAPHGMRLSIAWDDKWLNIVVQDRGPGFPADILRDCGATPLPAHADGCGIGLWLARAAVERMGGRFHLANAATGGGVATIELPLPAPEANATQKIKESE